MTFTDFYVGFLWLFYVSNHEKEQEIKFCILKCKFMGIWIISGERETEKRSFYNHKNRNYIEFNVLN